VPRLARNERARVVRVQFESPGVRIMTMIGSKGLTVRATIIAGLEDGIVPRPDADLAEERRLLYVAMTRAKEFLLCTWAGQRRGPTERAAIRLGFSRTVDGGRASTFSEFQLIGAGCLTFGNNIGNREKFLDWLAERVGFEPTVEFPQHTLSKRAP
jgi:ATP-dependent exoDNAse (exonuclease V) beta subunit